MISTRLTALTHGRNDTPNYLGFHTDYVTGYRGVQFTLLLPQICQHNENQSLEERSRGNSRNIVCIIPQTMNIVRHNISIMDRPLSLLAGFCYIGSRSTHTWAERGRNSSCDVTAVLTWHLCVDRMRKFIIPCSDLLGFPQILNLLTS
jgi:hypothetical protein